LRILPRFRWEQTDDEQLRLLLGKQLAIHVRERGVCHDLHEAEFRVFSQFGDDGIIQYLVGQTKPTVHKFIEFGVENYAEANTRFLLANDNWSGLIIDGSEEHIASIKRNPNYWRQDLTAVCAFVDRENISRILAENGFSGQIGLLSIDIDGNDYWIWEAIDTVNPVLVVIEYNSVFGRDHAVSIPYDPNFNRTRAHYSNLYWGCSLKALCGLAERKGYAFVGSNSAGNNAHFVRKDKVGVIPVLSAEQGYVESKFRESRDRQGRLTYLSGNQRLHEIRAMPVFHLERQQLVRLGDL
jgi:hypothetical protein